MAPTSLGTGGGPLLLPRPPSSARISFQVPPSSSGASYASASEGSANEDEAERRAMNDYPRVIRGLPKRRSSEMLRSEQGSPHTHIRGATGRLLETIQALSGSVGVGSGGSTSTRHIGDVEDDASGESPCSPTTPPLANVSMHTASLSQPDAQQQANSGFRFTNLPASLRPPSNPIAMARSLLPALRSATASATAAAAAAAGNSSDYLNWEAKFEATLGSQPIDKATSEQLMALAGLRFDANGALMAPSAQMPALANTAGAPLSSMYAHDVPYPADLRAERYSDADGSSSYSGGGLGDGDGNDADGSAEAEAWSSQAGNKKKRKSTRAAGNEDRGHAGTGAPDYPQAHHGGAGGGASGAAGGGTHVEGVDRDDARGAYETDYADLPFVRRKARVPLSVRSLVERRLIVVARARAFRMTKYRERLAAQQAAAAPEPEKKQPKRLSKAEKRAHAMRAGSGAKPQTTLAALRAKVAAAGGKAEVKSPEPVPESAAPPPPRSPSPPPRKPVVVPTSSFSFTLPSPIVAHLAQMRSEFEALQARLTDSMRPVDAAVNSATDAFSRLDTRDPHEPATFAKPRETTRPAFTSSSTIAPSSPPVVKVQPPMPSPMPLPPPPPPLLNPSKMSRRKKANMGNVHHRSNYVPSRIPSDRARTDASTSNAPAHIVSADAPPGLDHPTTTSALFSDEWMCVFCEYRMLYGEYPRMLKACKQRKKLVGKRTKAQARAHRVAEGGSLGESAAEKRKKKQMRPRCTCGDHSDAESEMHGTHANAGSIPQHTHTHTHPHTSFAHFEQPAPLNHNIDDID